MPQSRLKIIPLGGLSEIGKNMLVLEYEKDVVVIDAGIMFPEEDMLGVDLVLPDTTYLMENKDKVRGILITHGHEDHIGALPYVLRQLDVPVYAPRLAHGLISVKLKEHKILKNARLRVVEPGQSVKLGNFKVEFFRVCHSIPDAMGLVIRTPVGTVVHTGDFKLDHTPVDGKPTDLAKLARLGSEGVLLLLSDSTYVEIPGYTPTEQVVGDTFERVMAQAPGRVIVATFSSLVSRVQQIINAADEHGRRVCILGRSMIDTFQMALNLGYLKIPQGILADVDELRRLPPEKTVIVMTGSQGEPTSALVRMANRDHRQLRVIPGDTVVISATPIPGNETLVSRTINNLFRQGARVLYDRLERVHVHGHASQEELKMMINLIRPCFFVPVHGEYRHLALHARLGETLGIPREKIFVLEDGDVLELSQHHGKVTGRVSAGHIYVDGLGTSDVGGVVLRDRRLLSKDGVVVVVVAIDKRTGKAVSIPDVVSLGFVDMQESSELIERTRRMVKEAVDHSGAGRDGKGAIDVKVKNMLGKFFYEQTRRRPMIIPVTLEV
ncbi:MAG: ribonuclease J [Chloroflexi bacterium]|nr:ribonuclease J [Chloroflexota bacterium]